jgi:hypothetical protein
MAAYTENFSESLTTTDRLSEQHSRTVVHTEPGSASDSVVRQIMVRRVGGETLTLSEAPSRFAQHVRDFTEDILAVDVTNRKFSVTQAISESNTTSDSVVSAQSFNIALSESLTTNQISSRKYESLRSDIENLVLGQISTASYSAHRNMIETLENSQDVSYHHTSARTIVETHTTGTVSLRYYTALRTPSETFRTSDNVSDTSGTHRSLTERIGTSESVHRSLGATRDLSEALTGFDSLTTQRHGFNSRSLSETESTADFLAIPIVQHLHARQIVEWQTVEDSVIYRLLLPIEGWVNYNPITGVTTYDLPDWGWVLTESPIENSLSLMELVSYQRDFMREK